MLFPTSPTANAANLNAFRQRLQELGYVEGRNLVIDYRSAEGRPDRFPVLAAELVNLKADLIMTRGTPAALAAKSATRTIPVVMAAIGEAVETGVVASIAHPGGNITGLSSFIADVVSKRLELLSEMVQNVRRIGRLSESNNPVSRLEWDNIQKAARSLRIEAYQLDVRRTEDFGPAFELAVSQRADALIVGIDDIVQANMPIVIELTARHRLPAIYSSREYVEAGGLMSFGVNYPDLYRRVAVYVDRIFKGTKPSDLPIEQPTKVEFVINHKTAKALGLDVPPTLARPRRRGDRMRRREFITLLGGAAAAWPLAARAQQAAKFSRLGVLLLSTPQADPQMETARRALHDLGYVEGHNLSIEYRYAGGRPERLPDLAADLVRTKPDVLFALGGDVTPAAVKATHTIPIVFTSSADPVRLGFVASLARPGGNATGVTFLLDELASKRLEIFKQAAPRISRVGFLWNPDHPDNELPEAERTAVSLGVELKPLAVRGPADFDAAFVAATEARVDALYIVSSRLTLQNVGRILNFAAENRLPLVGGFGAWAKQHGLLSYGPNIDDMTSRAVAYIDRILKGTKPADLPIQQPTRFELVINLKTAKALGLNVPLQLQQLADEVIE